MPGSRTRIAECEGCGRKFTARWLYGEGARRWARSCSRKCARAVAEATIRERGYR